MKLEGDSELVLDFDVQCRFASHLRGRSTQRNLVCTHPEANHMSFDAHRNRPELVN